MQYYKLKEMELLVLLLCIEGCTKNACLIVGLILWSIVDYSFSGRLAEVIIVDSGRKATHHQATVL